MRRTRCCGRTFLCNAVITSSNFAKLAIIFKHNLFLPPFFSYKAAKHKKRVRSHDILAETAYICNTILILNKSWF